MVARMLASTTPMAMFYLTLIFSLNTLNNSFTMPLLTKMHLPLRNLPL